MATICRACLTSEMSLQPIDDNFIRGYNTLTNILVITSDGLPQFTCINCLENVTNFLLFRDKCIESENTLRHILCEAGDSKDGIIKGELVNESSIKEELQVKQEIHVENQTCFENDSDSQVSEDKGDYYYDLGCDRDNNEHISFKKDVIRKSQRKSTRQKSSKNLSKKKKNTLPTLKIISENDTGLFCGMCSKKFEDRINLNEHLESHKKYKECELCREKFHEWPSLLAHRITHINRFKEKKCHYCEKLFKSVYKLELHYRSLHYDGENKFLTCKYCLKSFATARKLCRHISAHHVNLQMFQCDHCKKFITSKHGLVTHLRKHSEDRPFKCDLCDYSCKYRGGVRAHKMRKHSETKVVYCKTCGRDFASTELLNKHNCKSRATMCPICGVIKAKRLTVHMATHHMGILFKCQLCPAEFKSKSALRVHTEKHSGNRRYSCEFCSMKFFTASVLMKHRRVHTGEKPFICKVCQKGFTGNHNLRVHMKVHGEDLIVKRVKNTSPAENNGLFYTTE